MMKKRIITRIAGIVCGAALSCMLSIGAFAQTDLPIGDRRDIAPGMINFVGGNVTAEAEEFIMFPVYIRNNSAEGFTSVHLRLLLDKELVPAFKADGTPIVKKGIRADDEKTELHASYDANTGRMDLEINSTEPITENDVLARIAIVLPEKVRDTYTVRVEIERGAEDSLQDCTALNGTIDTAAQTAPPAVTTTAEPVRTMPAASSTVHTTARPAIAAATVTYAATTTIAATNPLIPYTTTVRTTVPVPAVGYGGAGAGAAALYPNESSYPSGADWNSGTGTTNGSGTAALPAGAVSYDSFQSGTTDITNGSGISTDSVKTGDISIGIAVAGLMLAAGTAVVIVIRKRK